MSRILRTATRYSVLPESGETVAVSETQGALRQEQGEGRESLVERVRKGVRLQGDTYRRTFRNVETGRPDATGQVVETVDPIFGKVELVVGVQVVGVLARQCLDTRIPDLQTLTNQVEAWKSDRNQKHRTVDWQFTTTDARIKLKKLYPKF